MNVAWIAGRFLLVGLVLSVAFVSLGSDYSRSSLYDNQESGGYASDETQELVGDPEDLVKDWEKDLGKPKFVLMVTGRQHGYIEPCGCITLARQKGGLMRRHAVQKILQARGWDVVPIDAGNQVRRFGQQPVIKLRKTYEALCKQMGYEVIGLGPDDLKLPAIDLAQMLANVGEQPFTCANVKLMNGMNSTSRVIERGGKRIGVTMIVGDEHLDGVKQQFVDTVPVAQGLATAVQELNAAKCDMKVLIAFTEVKTCRQLAKDFPVFDLLVTAGGAGDPTLEPELIQAAPNRQTPMIQVGVKGMHVGLVGYFENNGQPKIEYERVELDHRYKDSEAIKTIFKSYQDELKTLWDNGDLKDIIQRDHSTGLKFVGSAKCADCHDEEYAIWEDGVDGNGGPHQKATKDLERNPNDDRVWVQRHHDPECVSCHATGWNPQKFYPYKTGFMSLNDDDLLGNGCENCHGPGSAHVEIEEAGNADPAERVKRARQMHLSVAKARLDACKECHDLDNSPDFLLEGGFDKYWPNIKHGRPAVEKAHDVLEAIAAGQRPIQDLDLIQDWLPDMKDQNPTQVVIVEQTLSLIAANPTKVNDIIKTMLPKLEVE
jgi:hypothetical protein